MLYHVYGGIHLDTVESAATTSVATSTTAALNAGGSVGGEREGAQGGRGNKRPRKSEFPEPLICSIVRRRSIPAKLPGL